ncbi:hypothetical protein M8C21_016123, partial [Ambrosia artemisiifolia]
MARSTTDVSRGRGFVARGGRGCGQGVVAGILFCVQGVMFFEALFLSIMQAQLAICCQELAGSWSRGRSQHSKFDQGLWCQADRGKKRGKVYGLSNAINPHVHGKEDELKVDKDKLIELSGTSEDESSSVSNFTMSPNVAKTVVCKYT